MTARVHLIGVGGSGMKGLARYYRRQGFAVSGSDLRLGSAAEVLRRAGVEVFEGHDARLVRRGLDLVVMSRAVPAHNSEVCEARRRGLEVLTYSQALGRILRCHGGLRIGVAGTHGKTSTSAWLARMLIAGGRDPSFIIGGDVEEFEGNVRVGAGPDFVVEACEYGGSFHDLRPTAGVILNIEDDHQECYGGPEGLRAAFGRFARALPARGLLFLNRSLLPAARGWAVRARVVPVDPRGGRGGPGYRLEPPASRPAAFHTLVRDGEPVVALRCALPGRFSLANMLFAAAVATEIGVAPDAIRRAAGAVRGVRRRVENRGHHRGVTVIDDYAHHPTEVRAVLAAARGTFDGRCLKVVFEPHQFRRLKAYLGGFARELARADQVVVTEVFAARERPEEWRMIGPEDLVSEIRTRRGAARFLPLEQVVRELPSDLERGDVVMTLGAGRSSEVAHGLVGALR